MTRKNLKKYEIISEKKLVYSTTNFIKFPLAEALRRIAEGGFKNVEIWGNIKHLDPRNESENVDDIKHVCGELGLRVTSIHAPFTLDYDGEPAQRMRSWEKLVCKSMEHAIILGAGLIVIHPVNAWAEDSLQGYRESVRSTEDSILRIAEEAQEKGVRVAIENMPAHRMRRYGSDVGELYRFIKDSGKGNLGICLDTGHVVFNKGDVLKEFTQHKNNIFVIHMNDNIWGMHMDLHLVPGSGSVDWGLFRQELKRESFDGIIVMELDGRGRPSSIFSEACEFAGSFFSDQPDNFQSPVSANRGSEK